MRGSLRPFRRAVVNLAVAGLGLWAAFGLAMNVRHLQWRQAGNRWLPDEPCLWRYGTPPTERLEGFLAEARTVLEKEGVGRGEVVGFTSRFEGREGLCAYLWAFYFLPEATLRRAPAVGGRTGSWIHYGPAPPPPDGAGVLLSSEAGAVYRWGR